MSINQFSLRHVINAALLLSAASGSTMVYAADPSQEQCAGVIKAGQNDCATSTNACHGHSAKDSSAMAWIYVPQGTCEKIAGAHLVTVKDPTPKKS
jgi:uncharacterized membrane protein